MQNSISLDSWETSAAHDLATALFQELGMSRPQPMRFPDLKISNVIIAAGELSGHPLHIANFLPADEGIYKSDFTTTIIYNNLFLKRFDTVTAELANKYFLHPDYLPNGEDAWNHLLLWFRGHDIGHCYLDQLFKGLKGLSTIERYTLQELAADLFGFFFATSVVAQNAVTCNHDEHQLSQLIAEALRYSQRECTLFPDAGAAQILLGSCIESGTLIIEPNGRLTFDHVSLVSDVRRLLLEVLALAASSAAIPLHILIDRFVHMDSRHRFDALTKTLPCTDLYPVFASLDRVTAASRTRVIQPSESIRDLDIDHVRVCQKE
jgi:hypothetical protein